MSAGADAERRIHQLEEQLRQARDDALEEAAKMLEQTGLGLMHSADLVRRMKGTPT